MNVSKRLFAVVGLSLSVAACGDTTDMGVDEAGDNNAALAPASLLTAAWDASAQEHTAAEIAKLALHRSKNDAVLAWAKASMAAHQQAYNELRSLGDTLHLKISRIMTIEGERQYAALFVRGSNSFDPAFKETLQALQNQGLAYTNTLNNASNNAQLRAWASQAGELWKSEQQSVNNLP
jgi:predicted outer membrane protein